MEKIREAEISPTSGRSIDKTRLKHSELRREFTSFANACSPLIPVKNKQRKRKWYNFIVLSSDKQRQQEEILCKNFISGKFFIDAARKDNGYSTPSFD
ncbi:MAG: hypothetical protein VW643_07415, partial [Opitutales bacterium]